MGLCDHYNSGAWLKEKGEWGFVSKKFVVPGTGCIYQYDNYEDAVSDVINPENIREGPFFIHGKGCICNSKWDKI